MLIKRNIVILHPSDKTACAFYRCHAIATLLNTDKGGEVEAEIPVDEARLQVKNVYSNKEVEI